MKKKGAEFERKWEENMRNNGTRLLGGDYDPVQAIGLV